ncbi:hypothetical protein CAPTEDRAFT_224847 [Capitella teleta]|uniref:Rhodanese domain-containing protein n=1 Tax=Capitella teleta TaxID=283909 RepID=R7UIE8_CAPTE|nr:hypothetical protein CAPTEDRAFT_224847 [Capitella teleta]|eukprot:ELU06339.1 hypothetical protein CAPTEDRAFT_224847 [Capitella teleta]
MNKIEEIRKNYKFRKDEIFKRMKVTTFVQLVIQVNRIFAYDEYCLDGGDSDRPGTVDAELMGLNTPSEDGRTSPAASLALTEGDYGEKPETARSTLLSVSRGIGELDLNASNQHPPSTPSQIAADTDASLPYLLLDVRESDEFDQCHIISALSYPKAILSRAVNYESKEMLAFKNREGKIIIIYDEDERIASYAATTLVQRGYDNLFMLSGGLKVCGQLFPDGLISGNLPESIQPKRSVKKAPPPAPAPSAHPLKFTPHDIDKIEMFLDNALQDHSIGTFKGRLSHASTNASRTSRASARSTTSSLCPQNLQGRPAFK